MSSATRRLLGQNESDQNTQLLRRRERCPETLLRDYHRQHRLGIKVVRNFNTYGRRMHPNYGRVISTFILQALKVRDLSIYGSAQQARSLRYVDDLIEAMVGMMKSGADFSGPANIGNQSEHSMLELAQQIIKLTGNTSWLIHHPLPADDPKQRQPNMSLAKENLKGQSKVSLGNRLTAIFAKLSTCLSAT
jgi:UDP-glucuronate decarboxylase